MTVREKLTAVDWAMEGLDFADALHLAGSEGRSEFATFDRGFIRRAAVVGHPAVQEP